MNKNKLRVALSAVAVALMLAGCDTTPDPLYQRVPTPVVIVETAPTATAEPDEFHFGDIVWVVCRCQAEEAPHVTRHAVVSQEGDYLTVTTCITDDPDVLRQVLPEYLTDPEVSVELLLVAECYKSEAEAQVATDAENGG